ncbi:Cerato-platanin-domain-containing protein [Daedalea quercina L-15889]|uniref:Cerato-platanin-domain-containing protein n=1 Tax=Daedalea quercina L-15889 TaxID=1314783 RepID=A0A165TWN0_9APHY|nr:Cerato-platanin-domain-containing protein [Daedalea quercina L-15889]
MVMVPVFSIKDALPGLVVLQCTRALPNALLAIRRYASIMQLFGISAVLALCASAVLGQSTSVNVTYDNYYDDGSNSVEYVACSEYLETLGYTSLGSLPGFPNIGGAQSITGFDSSACGTCWSLTYGSNTIYVFAIDTANDGFNIAETAMNNLTNDQAEFLGRVLATASQVDGAQCGQGEVPTN